MTVRRIAMLLTVLTATALAGVACKREPPPAGGPAAALPGEAPAGPERSAFLLNRGTKLLAEGRSDEAAKVLELAHQANPSSPRIAVELSRAYVGLKQFDKAGNLLKPVLTSPATPPEDQEKGREVLVDLLLGKGDVSAAEQACAPLLKGIAVSGTAHRLSGMILYRKGDPESLKRAVAELRQAVNLSPSDAEARTALGLSLLKVNDLPGSAAALEEAVKLDPASETALSNLAKVYEMQGKSAEAESTRKRFQEVYDSKSLRQKVGPLRAKGVEAFNAGHLDEALSAFQEVLKMAPKDSQALAQIGSVYLVMPKLDEAESALRRALELSPDDDFALTEMGRLRALRNDLPGAIDLLQHAVRSNPDAPEPHYFLAGIYYAQQRKEDFLREKAAFERLRKTTPVGGIMELPEAPGS